MILINTLKKNEKIKMFQMKILNFICKNSKNQYFFTITGLYYTG